MLAVDDGSFVWVGLYEPDDALLEKLQEEFGLHDLAVEDAQHAHQRPKIEAYGNSLFIAVHTAQLVDGHDPLRRNPCLPRPALPGHRAPRRLAVLRAGARARGARARTAGARPGLRRCTRCSTSSSTTTCRSSTSSSDELNALEQDIFAETFRRDTIVKLYELKRELTQLRLAVVAAAGHPGAARRASHGALVPDEVRLYFRDVLDHAVRVNESTDTLREMLTAAMSVNLSLVTVSQGEVVKRLAGWAALLAAPTLIASWYGMNFEHMPELHGRYSYAILIGVVGVVVLGLYRYLKKVRWL